MAIGKYFSTFKFQIIEADWCFDNLRQTGACVVKAPLTHCRHGLQHITLHCTRVQSVCVCACMLYYGPRLVLSSLHASGMTCCS
eukprot:327534-Chlamydomonas_euryale.AAC.3